MSAPIFYFYAKATSNRANEYGETALQYAPVIRLSNGKEAVPQQYLDVQRTLDNVSNVLAKITTPDDYQLFAGQEGSVLYIVVGHVGRENYPQNEQAATQDKIVYGRRWLIEETTPTSEIVQTALLAIKKVREHEVRELFYLTINQGKNTTTPFNCHLDMPLMAGNHSVLAEPSSDSLESLLSRVRFAGFSFEITSKIHLADKTVVALAVIGDSDEQFSELNGESLMVVCDRPECEDFLHQLIAALISLSDRYVEETLAFNDFERFSHSLNPVKLAEFSYQTRNVQPSDKRFDSAFKDMSYRVDSSKAPIYNKGTLGQQQSAFIAAYADLGGYLPRQK